MSNEEPFARMSLLVASAATPAELTGVAEELARELEQETACRPSTFHGTNGPHRLAAVGADRAGLRRGLRLFLDGVPDTSWIAGRADPGGSPVAWCFGGHGSQWPGMGLGFGGFPRSAFLSEVDALIEERIGFSPLRFAREDPARAYEDLAVVQPLIFAVQVTMAEVLRGSGLRPDVVVGYSMGEVAAAYAAGVLSLPDAVEVICRRSQLLASAPANGRMVVARVDAETAQRACAGGAVSVAAYPSPAETVLTGDAKELEPLVQRWQDAGVRCRWVRIDAASHSPAVDGVRAELARSLSTLRPNAGHTPWKSTVDPDRLEPPTADAEYWVRNLRESVRFAAAVGDLLGAGFETFLEVGPHPVLRSPLLENARMHAIDAAKVITTGQRGIREDRALLRTAAQLHCHGAAGADRRWLADFHASAQPA